MVEVPLVSEQQRSEVAGQLELPQLVQEVVGVAEAVSVADAVHHHERFSPPDVVVQTTCRLQSHTPASDNSR